MPVLPLLALKQQTENQANRSDRGRDEGGGVKDALIYIGVMSAIIAVVLLVIYVINPMFENACKARGGAIISRPFNISYCEEKP